MTLTDVRVALLIEDEYQILEGWYPLLRLQAAGAAVKVVGSGVKKSYDSKEHYPMDVDLDASEARVEDFDAVIVPGGFAPDNMRLHPEMIDFVRQMFQSGKLTAAICHGGWVLASAGVLKGKKATGYRPIRDDVENAGGTWLDQAVVEDGNVITARTPVDLPQFGEAIVNYLRPGDADTASDTSVTAATNVGDTDGSRYEVGAVS